MYCPLVISNGFSIDIITSLLRKLGMYKNDIIIIITTIDYSLILHEKEIFIDANFMLLRKRGSSPPIFWKAVYFYF